MRRFHMLLVYITMLIALLCRPLPGWTQTAAYAQMAPVEKYLAADRGAEISLARTAAPPAISDAATVLLLTPKGYEVAEKGRNGFTCLVERSWMSHFDSPQFWNWHVRTPVCYNPEATRSILPYTLFRTDLVLHGVGKGEMMSRITAAAGDHTLPVLEVGSMAYMMSKQQYLTDIDPANGITTTSWHPHLMFYAPASDVADNGASFGANVKGSPVILDTTGGVPEPWTLFFVPVGHWSDGSSDNGRFMVP